MTNIAIPEFNTVRRSNKVFQTRGMIQSDDGAKPIYVPFEVLQTRGEATNNISLAPNSEVWGSGNTGPAVDVLIRVVTIGRGNNYRNLFIYFSGVYCEYFPGDIPGITGRSEIRPISDEANGLQNAPNSIAWPIEFNNKTYLIFSNSDIYELNERGSGGTLITTNIDAAKELNGITIDSPQDRIIGVEQYYNRIFLIMDSDPGVLMWSEINSLENWLQELVADDGSTSYRTAGRTRFSDSRISAFKVIGQTGLVFLENGKIYQVVVADFTTQFAFTEFPTVEVYIGGAIALEHGLYFMAVTGIKKLSGGIVEHISDPIDNRIEISDITRISVVSSNERIIWLIDNPDQETVTASGRPQGKNLIYHDTLDDTFVVEENVNITVLGSLFVRGGTIGDLDRLIGEINEPIGQLGEETYINVGYDSTGQEYRFDVPREPRIKMFLEDMDTRGAVNIRTVSCSNLIDGRGVAEYRIRIEDQYGKDIECKPNRWGQALFNEKFSAPTIEIISTNNSNSISSVDIDFEVDNY